MYKNPPILKIPMTKWERIFNIIGVTAYIISLIYLIFQLGNIPEKIPGHFNSKGEVDRWGSKYELFILPILSFFIFSIISLMEKAPNMYNYPKRLNEANAKQFYLNSRITINFIKNVILVIFSYLLFQIVQISLGKIDSLSFWFTPIVIVIIIGAIVVSIYRSSKIK